MSVGCSGGVSEPVLISELKPPAPRQDAFCREADGVPGLVVDVDN